MVLFYIMFMYILFPAVPSPFELISHLIMYLLNNQMANYFLQYKLSVLRSHAVSRYDATSFHSCIIKYMNISFVSRLTKL